MNFLYRSSNVLYLYIIFHNIPQLPKGCFLKGKLGEETTPSLGGTENKTTAGELAEQGINVNTIAPGFIKSDMTHVLSEEASQRLLSQIPMNRPGNPEDVANVVLFLVSDLAKYVTGQVVNVDGGMVM
ncbi:MAG: SDR family oxidoreductase [Firmicutes bacterium]|nr:SDR family oxidoreductase [Bacillota bacterium]